MARTRPGRAVIEELARERLGFGQLRPGQVPAVQALASGRDALAVLPTGGSARWGEGTVQRYDGDHVTLLFGEHGYRELFVPLVLDRGLLRPA